MTRALLVLWLLCCVESSLSAPGRSADEVLIGQVDIAMRGDDDAGNAAVDENSIDSRAEDSFTKKCYVDDKYYSHSEMIPSRDLGSHCLCVAGEVYCWWQTYGGQRIDILTPKSTRAPADQEDDEEEDEEDSGVLEEQAEQRQPENKPEASGESSAEASGEQQDDGADDPSEEDEEDDEDEDEDEELEGGVEADSSSASQSNNSTSTSRTTTAAAAATQSTRAPSTCLVMGRTYQEGEVLPRLTGNCVECSCGRESRIQCSPRDCVSLGPQLAAGAGDGLFGGLERDRGLVGSF